MNKSNVKKNYLFNLVYQIFSIIVPLITTPYVSRVLGPSNIGRASYSNSLISYFTMLAALGFNVYAQREIARNQGNKEQQTVLFWEIFICKSISTLTVLVIYCFLIISNVFGNYGVLMSILSLNLLSVLVDITFLFQGNEQFKTIVIRNLFIRLLGIVSIFIFVKDGSDLNKYVFCQSFIIVCSNFVMWIYLPGQICKISVKQLNICRHFLPTVKLFLPSIAIFVYTVLDKTLIGILIPGSIVQTTGEVIKIANLENGYYEQSERIIKLTMTIITSLGTVMIPRNSQALASGNIKEFNKNINGAIRFVFILGMPMMCGLAAISKNLSPWFFGPGYDKVPLLMINFSSLIMIIGLSNVLGVQYLLPQKRDTQYTLAITFGAIVNVILNLVLIPRFWSIGACIATIVAEAIVTVIMFFFARKDIKFLELINYTWKYIVSGIAMFMAVYFTNCLLSPSILHTLLLVLEGIIVYGLSLVIIRDQLFGAYIRKIYLLLKKYKHSN